ncbi:hypothetical protein KIPB_008776, partial [Kipferlia bialata]|eukprot:g8776.t1
MVQTKGEARPQMRSSMNVVNSLVGAGFLSQPYAYQQLGWVLGLVVIGVAFVLHRAACYAILKATQHTGATSLSQVVDVTLGKRYAKPLAWTVILSNFSYLVTYLVVAGDYLISFVPSVSQGASRILVSLFTMLPLSLLGDLRGLGPVSAVSVLSTAALSLGVVGLAVFVVLGADPSCIPKVDVSDVPTFTPSLWPQGGLAAGLSVGLPLVTLSLGAQFAVSSIYNSVAGTHKERGIILRRAVTYGFIIVTALGALFGMAGSGVFGTETQDNVLLNLVSTSGLAIVLKVMVAVMVTCAYPLVVHCARDSLTAMMTIKEASLPRVRTMLALTIYTLVTVTSILAPSISVVLVISSGTAGTVIYFLVPALIALRLDPLSEVQEQYEWGTEGEGDMSVDGEGYLEAEGLAHLTEHTDHHMSERERRDSVFTATVAMMTGTASSTVRRASQVLHIGEGRRGSVQAYVPPPKVDRESRRNSVIDSIGIKGGRASSGRSRSNSLHGVSWATKKDHLVRRDMSTICVNHLKHSI